MPFYLRKSFRFGPLRLNLSKSGLGASFGVTGARIGINSRGRAYVHGGRGGLYFRESLGTVAGGGGHGGARGAGGRGARRKRRATGAAYGAGTGTITLYQDTGVTYAPDAAATDADTIERLEIAARLPDIWPYRLGVGVGLVLVAVGAASAIPFGVGSSGAGPLVTDAAASGAGTPAGGLAGGAAMVALGLALLVGMLFPLKRVRDAKRARDRLRAMLAPAVAERRPLNDVELGRVRAALDDPALRSGARRSELERAYLHAARRIARDGQTTDEELRLLEQFETRLGLARTFCDAARVDAFHGVYLEAVADRELTGEEERALAALRAALRVPDDAVADELDIVRRLSELRRIREGELPVVETDIPLRDGEKCHFEAEARLLKERSLRRFQRDRQKYRVRGLVVDREGTLVVTDRRLLLVHEGSTSVRLDDILDLEVDADRSLLRIARDGVKTPLLITTPDAVRAGAVVAGVAGL